MHTHSISSWKLAGLTMIALFALAACGSDEPAGEPPLIAPAILEEVAEEPDPNALRPDAGIEAVVVDAETTTTVAGEDGRVPTPEAPVIEVVEYDDLAFVEGERVIVRTQLGSTREGVLKRFLNTGLKVVVQERGREIELDMPRTTISEVKVVWTRAQGLAPAPSP